MQIPDALLDDLAKINLPSYEWRVLVIIMQKQFHEEDGGMTNISLNDFCKATNIPKSHVSRAVINLALRNVVQRFTYKSEAVYQVLHNPENWRSMLDGKDAATISSKIENAFAAWIERYPNPMHAEDAKQLYAKLIQDGEATIQDLDDALEGYLRHEEVRSKEFRRDPSPWTCMYPTSFLKGRWKEYIEFKDLKRRGPDL